MLFKEITAVYTENHTESKMQYAEELTVISTGTYSYHSALRGYFCLAEDIYTTA
jgi:hypothetical protein